MQKETYEQTLTVLAERLVTPERYGSVAVQLMLPEFEDAES